MSEAVVIAARRTPIGNAGGVLRALTADELAAPVLRALLADAGAAGRPAPPSAPTPARAERRGPAGEPGPGLEVADVILGNVFGPGGNTARVAALRAGLGFGVPGLTVDRQCASGLAAIVVACSLVRAGAGSAYLAGGTESASTAPHRAWRTDPPTPYSRAPFAPADLGDPDMGPAADLVAAEAGISRDRQDRFALRSHERAVAAQRAGRFADEIVPLATTPSSDRAATDRAATDRAATDRGDAVTRDQRPRAGFTSARLARFPPAFTPDGTATAANSCAVSDGAAAVMVVDEETRRRLGVPGLRLVASATSGVDPSRLGLGAVPAMREVLKYGVPAVTEFTEAFAGQTLACLDAAGLDERTASPDGGAIALGHPWGASGAVLVVRLFTRLVRERRGGLGLTALSAGGGVGVAALWEAVGVDTA
ncbi:thiolase family protein [Pseudonocardia xishanensis]|uniref:Thiolase family protein n=1 Tax=Pseudonocardia xishanensis TaxID=630995 RepID=A0ABP8RG05_9PSEU